MQPLLIRRWLCVIELASVLDERVTLARMNARTAAPAFSCYQLGSAQRRACLLVFSHTLCAHPIFFFVFFKRKNRCTHFCDEFLNLRLINILN